MISVAIFLGVYIHNGIIDLWICWGYSRAVFLRPGVASRGCASLTLGCVLAPLQGAGGGDDWMMWGWVWRVGGVGLRSGRLW